MEKNVIKARLVWNNEAVALGYVEPFDMARDFDDIAQLFRGVLAVKLVIRHRLVRHAFAPPLFFRCDSDLILVQRITLP